MKYVIDTPQTIKDFLTETPLSKAMIKRIKKDGDFLVNGHHQTVRYQLKKGDLFQIKLPQETTTIKPQKIPLTIIYEDDHYLIIDKQPGMPCIPTKRYPVNTLLSTDIKQVKRVYHCLVDGFLQGEGTIQKPILRKENSVERYIDDRGKISITHYRVLKHFSHQTLVECRLETGRTHQIRVHMASLGHPLSGDVLYGSHSKQDIYLESVEIQFLHPYTKKQISFQKNF